MRLRAAGRAQAPVALRDSGCAHRLRYDGAVVFPMLALRSDRWVSQSSWNTNTPTLRIFFNWYGFDSSEAMSPKRLTTITAVISDQEERISSTSIACRQRNFAALRLQWQEACGRRRVEHRRQSLHSNQIFRFRTRSGSMHALGDIEANLGLQDSTLVDELGRLAKFGQVLVIPARGGSNSSPPKKH